VALTPSTLTISTSTLTASTTTSTAVISTSSLFCGNRGYFYKEDIYSYTVTKVDIAQYVIDYNNDACYKAFR